mmetsp:Transcript_5695/g.20725  ORF Transcript_5695/g.20725 Transcript_5695/m.20725 type:complete len:444 (+) Transcript_5695:131-1462(+)
MPLRSSGVVLHGRTVCSMQHAHACRAWAMRVPARCRARVAGHSAAVRRLRTRCRAAAPAFVKSLKDVVVRDVNEHAPHPLGMIVNPVEDDFPFSFSAEVFDTETHLTVTPGFQLFFVVSGSGSAFLKDSETGELLGNESVQPGDIVLFPPQGIHGIACDEGAKIHALGLMLHAPGVGRSAVEFGSWFGGDGDDVGFSAEDMAILCPQYLQEQMPSDDMEEAHMLSAEGEGGSEKIAWDLEERFSQATGMDIEYEYQPDNLRKWPVKRSLWNLRGRYLLNAKGIAANETPTNQLALVFDSSTHPFNFALEMFDKGHITPLHSHPSGHELFYILEGKGTAICDGQTWDVKAGDTVVFPARSFHGLNNEGDGLLYALELMVPEHPDKILDGTALTTSWDITCSLDGRTGKVSCSDISFSQAIQQGKDAGSLGSKACGFAPHACMPD